MRARMSRIADLAVPIVAGAFATNAMGLIDTAMVGRLGDTALAGVGIGGQLFFLLLGVLLGLSASVQATVARRVGQNQLETTGLVLNAGIVLALPAALLLMGVGYLLMPAVLSMINNDPRVSQQGMEYLATRMPSLILL